MTSNSSSYGAVRASESACAQVQDVPPLLAPYARRLNGPFNASPTAAALAPLRRTIGLLRQHVNTTARESPYSRFSARSLSDFSPSSGGGRDAVSEGRSGPRVKTHSEILGLKANILGPLDAVLDAYLGGPLKPREEVESRTAHERGRIHQTSAPHRRLLANRFPFILPASVPQPAEDAWKPPPHGLSLAELTKSAEEPVEMDDSAASPGVSIDADKAVDAEVDTAPATSIFGAASGGSGGFSFGNAQKEEADTAPATSIFGAATGGGSGFSFGSAPKTEAAMASATSLFGAATSTGDSGFSFGCVESKKEAAAPVKISLFDSIPPPSKEQSDGPGASIFGDGGFFGASAGKPIAASAVSGFSFGSSKPADDKQENKSFFGAPSEKTSQVSIFGSAKSPAETNNGGGLFGFGTDVSKSDKKENPSIFKTSLAVEEIPTAGIFGFGGAAEKSDADGVATKTKAAKLEEPSSTSFFFPSSKPPGLPDVNADDSKVESKTEAEKDDSSKEVKSAQDGDAENDEAPPPIKVDTTEMFWQVQIEAIYRRRNHHKLAEVPNLLEKFKGKEIVLYKKICKRYDLNPAKLYTDPKAWEDEEKDVKDDDGNAENATSNTAPPAPSSIFGSTSGSGAGTLTEGGSGGSIGSSFSFSAASSAASAEPKEAPPGGKFDLFGTSGAEAATKSFPLFSGSTEATFRFGTGSSDAGTASGGLFGGGMNLPMFGGSSSSTAPAGTGSTAGANSGSIFGESAASSGTSIFSNSIAKKSIFGGSANIGAGTSIFGKCISGEPEGVQDTDGDKGDAAPKLNSIFGSKSGGDKAVSDAVAKQDVDSGPKMGRDIKSIFGGNEPSSDAAEKPSSIFDKPSKGAPLFGAASSENGSTGATSIFSSAPSTNGSIFSFGAAAKNDTGASGLPSSLLSVPPDAKPTVSSLFGSAVKADDKATESSATASIFGKEGGIFGGFGGGASAATPAGASMDQPAQSDAGKKRSVDAEDITEKCPRFAPPEVIAQRRILRVKRRRPVAEGETPAAAPAAPVSLPPAAAKPEEIIDSPSDQPAKRANIGKTEVAEVSGGAPSETKTEDGPIKVETKEDFWKVQVEAIYRRRNQKKLGDVAELMAKHKGKEILLYKKVCNRYDLDSSKLYADPAAWEDEDKDVKDDEGGDDAPATQVPATSLVGDIFGGGGAPSESKPAPATSIFGGAPAAPSGSAPVVPSLFLPATTASGNKPNSPSVPSLFGGSAATENETASPAPSIFGTAPSGGIFSFNSGGSSGSGAAASSGTSIFGSNPKPQDGSIFGGGGSSPLGSGNIFGGGASSSGSIFGGGGSSGSIFGGSIFGSASSGSAASSGGSGIFGFSFAAPAATGGTSSPPTFGAGPVATFGAGPAATGGSASPPIFGSFGQGGPKRAGSGAFSFGAGAGSAGGGGGAKKRRAGD